ncbi:butyrophilin subfamily 3 member A1-like [Pristis pectinata]|uniref:butyrophilin subfamily 3 member A1-like n=1 Tax=Pristis pectinata TaxID=685728 RepID=UPI00223D1F8A|nr:butyrophilin subfamily 3 member A1-like [Pristis pectinata]
MGVVHCTVLLLYRILISTQGTFIVQGPADPLVAVAGGDVVLECQLVPPISASNMVVQWLKSGLDSPVHVYRHGQDDPLAQHQDYRARTELFKDEMTRGNIALRIKNVRRFDEGRYICSVGAGTDNEQAAVELLVLGLGSEPQIQMKGYHGDGIRLVCKSSGWYPEPEILWVSEDGRNLTQAETRSYSNTEGLVNVESSVGVTRQSTYGFKCLVQSTKLRIKHEAIIRISDDLFPGVSEWVLPLVLSICLLIAANSAVIYWNVKQNRRIKELELRKSIVEREWKRICGHEVSVTLDVETAHPELEVSEDLKSVRWTKTRRDLPDTGKRFTVRCSVLGSEGFTSGRHYWEVEVAGNQWWRLGVAAESVERNERVKLRLQTGYWSIEWIGDEFHVNTSPRSSLPADPIPGRVGVYLSYDSGIVSFYNVDTMTHLHTFTGNKFTEKLYPFFWTWYGNWLKICSGYVKGSGIETGSGGGGTSTNQTVYT